MSVLALMLIVKSTIKIAVIIRFIFIAFKNRCKGTTILATRHYPNLGKNYQYYGIC